MRNFFSYGGYSSSPESFMTERYLGKPFSKRNTLESVELEDKLKYSLVLISTVYRNLVSESGATSASHAIKFLSPFYEK